MCKSCHHVVISSRILDEDDDITLDRPDLIGAVHIGSLWRTGERGHATNALRCFLARHKGQTVTLIPYASGDQGPATNALRAWYARLGFVDDGEVMSTVA